MTRDDFIAAVKAKSPAYAALSDDDLYRRVITKYPQYKDAIDVGLSGDETLNAAQVAARQSLRQAVDTGVANARADAQRREGISPEQALAQPDPAFYSLPATLQLAALRKTGATPAQVGEHSAVAEEVIPNIAATVAGLGPVGAARSIALGYTGSKIGRHVGGWFGHPDIGSVVGGVAGAVDPSAVPAAARLVPWGIGYKLAPIFEKLLGSEPGIITSLARRWFGKAPNELSQAEMVHIVKNLSRGGEGDVVNPSVEEVAAKMVPSGELPPLTQSEMQAIVRGASPRPTPVSAVGKTMTPTGELPPMTQGEMTTVTRGVGKPPEGWVENPSPEMVAKYMQRPVPEGVDPEAVAALQKWGMSFEDAVKTASRGMVAPAAVSTGPKVLPMPARSVTASTPSTESIVLRLQQLSGGKITPEMEAYLAAQPEAEAAAMRAALGRASSKMPPVVGGLTVRPGPPATAPGDLEATLQASIDALKKRRAAQLALESQGKGVTVP